MPPPLKNIVEQSPEFQPTFSPPVSPITGLLDASQEEPITNLNPFVLLRDYQLDHSLIYGLSPTKSMENLAGSDPQDEQIFVRTLHLYV